MPKEKAPAEAGLQRQRIQKGPETIRDLGTGVPHHSQLEPSGGVPHRLGRAAADGGLTAWTFGNRFGVSLVMSL